MNTAIDNVLKFPGPAPGEVQENRPESSGKGFALIHRQFMDSRLYKDSQAVHLWLHLILKANHADEEVNTELGVITVRRGQMITGRPTLVTETYIPDNKVRSLLRTFEAKGMIKTSSQGRKFSLITIVKYDDFQTQNCPTIVQQMSNANPSKNAAHSDVCPTDVQGLSINNNILNTNVFNDRRRKPKSNPDAAIQSPKGDKWGTADDLRCAEWISALVESIRPSAKKTDLVTWANDIRLIRQIDEHDHREICELFKWASRDSFWCTNILSPAKLRKQWDTLTLQKGQPSRKRADDNQAVPHWNSEESWKEFL